MTEQNALRLADQTIQYLRRHNVIRALWLHGDELVRTPNADQAMQNMLQEGFVLVGVFRYQIERQDLADAIMAASA